MSPHRQLLLACCRAYWRASPGERPARLDVDWDRLLQDAHRLGVVALVRHSLTTVLDGARVPPEILRRLDSAYYRQAVRNARLAASLHQLLGEFARHRVAVIVLKGPSISELVYGNIALRRMVDNDILVRPGDLDLAERIVRELGYVPDTSSHPADWYRRGHHHLVPYRAPDGGSMVELHHHIFPPAAALPVPVEDLWRRARPVHLGSVPTLVLPPADLLLHLCAGLSAVERFDGGLRTLCDIAAVLERYRAALEWPMVLEVARAWAIERHLYYSLWLARRQVAAEVPGEVMETLHRSVHPDRLEDAALKWLIGKASFQYWGDRSVRPALISGLLAALLPGTSAGPSFALSG